MFTNKHVVVAMLVAPMLAIMAWYAVDHFIGEQPHAAKEGAAYSLVAKSNCRYASGQCDLANGDFELTLRRARAGGAGLTIELQSRFPLQQALINRVAADDASVPAAMRTIDTDGKSWIGTITAPADPDSLIRLAVVAEKTTYFAEVPTTFLNLDP